MRMRELSLRLSKSGGDRPPERKARGRLAGATSDGVERFVEDNRAKFNLQEDVRVRVSDDSSEGEEEGEMKNRSLPRDVSTSQKNHNMPSRVVTRQAVPSHEQTLGRRENLLLSHPTQEDTANVSRGSSSRSDTGDTETFVSYKWGHYEPVVGKPDESLIQSGSLGSIQ